MKAAPFDLILVENISPIMAHGTGPNPVGKILFKLKTATKIKGDESEMKNNEGHPRKRETASCLFDNDEYRRFL